MCARQVVGKAACVPQATTHTSRGEWPTCSDALEGPRHHRGKEPHSQVAEDNNQLLPFNEKSSVPGSTFSGSVHL